MNDSAAKEMGFEKRICHGMLVASHISKILAVNFPGPGTIYLNQTLSFRSPIYPDVKLRFELTVVEANNEKRKYLISTEVKNAENSTDLIIGDALILLK